MSQLTPFVRAFRTLADSLDASAAELYSSAEEMDREDKVLSCASAGLVVVHLRDSLRRAATDLEQQIARDLTTFGRQQFESRESDGRTTVGQTSETRSPE